jgi:hypothetical protein
VSILVNHSKRISKRLCPVLALGIAALLAGGCASGQSRRIDLASVQTIGVVVPPGSSEPGGAEDVMQLYNLTVGEDRLKNAAVGAGTGAVVGTAAGAGAGAIIGCAAFGPLAPWCWGSVLIAGAVLGGGSGAVAGTTVDTQERVEVAPVHLYEINQVLPGLTQDYLASPVLQERALQIVRGHDNAVTFVPAAWNGERHAPAEAATSMAPTTDINLVLTDMSVSLNGKAKDDPDLILNIVMHWSLTRYNPETHNDEAWDAMSARYESEKYQLSEWLADDGALLKAAVDTGIGKSMTSAFSKLPRMDGR